MCFSCISSVDAGYEAGRWGYILLFFRGVRSVVLRRVGC